MASRRGNPFEKHFNADIEEVVDSRSITFEQLAENFHLPINEVAKKLGVCMTVLKKVCRKRGIPRWPYRKLKAIDKTIEGLRNSSLNCPADAHTIYLEIESLEKKKQEIIENPAILALPNGCSPGVSPSPSPSPSPMSGMTPELASLTISQDISPRKRSLDESQSIVTRQTSATTTPRATTKMTPTNRIFKSEQDRGGYHMQPIERKRGYSPYSVQSPYSSTQQSPFSFAQPQLSPYSNTIFSDPFSPSPLSPPSPGSPRSHHRVPYSAPLPRPVRWETQAATLLSKMSASSQQSSSTMIPAALPSPASSGPKVSSLPQSSGYQGGGGAGMIPPPHLSTSVPPSSSIPLPTPPSAEDSSLPSTSLPSFSEFLHQTNTIHLPSHQQIPQQIPTRHYFQPYPHPMGSVTPGIPRPPKRMKGDLTNEKDNVPLPPFQNLQNLQS